VCGGGGNFHSGTEAPFNLVIISVGLSAKCLFFSFLMFLTDLMLSCSQWFCPYDQFFLFSVQQQETAVSQYTDEIMQTVFKGGTTHLKAQKGQHSFCVKTINALSLRYTAIFLYWKSIMSYGFFIFAK